MVPMKTTINGFAIATIAVVAFFGAGPSMGQASSTAREVAAIAEEAYLYGFPMIVGYDVLYQFFIDRGSKQFKAPINQLHNDARVFTPKDTDISTPNSDTPYSLGRTLGEFNRGVRRNSRRSTARGRCSRTGRTFGSRTR